MLMMMLLTGCKDDQETTTICKGKLDDTTTYTITIEAKGDTVNMVKEKYVYDLTDRINEDASIERWLPIIKSQDYDYNSFKGGQGKYKIEGNKIIKEIKLNYNEVDFDELIRAGLIDDAREGETIYISLAETIKGEKEAGSTCK